jgi:hypothetical protein
LHPTQPARRAVGGRAAVLRSPNFGRRGSTALPMMAEGERVRPARGGRRPAERSVGKMFATGRCQRRPGRSRSPARCSARPASSPESFRGLTRRNCARTSAGVAHTTCSNIPSPRPSGERVRERGFESRHLFPALSPVSDGGEGDRIVVTTAIRASAGMPHVPISRTDPFHVSFIHARILGYHG